MQEDSFNPITYLLGLFLTGLALAKYYLNLNFQKRMSHLRKRTSQDIPEDKIIVAIEPCNFLFDYSEICLSGYSEVALPQKGWEMMWARILRFFGRGMFFKPRYSKRTINYFFQSLTHNDKVQLFLYTTLPLQIAQLILKRMDVLQFFPKDLRRSSHEIGSDGMKCPIEVDINTRRVIIVTDSKKSFMDQDVKYFLVVGKGKESRLIKMEQLLQTLVRQNEDIDELHNELGFLKGDIQSEGEYA